MKKLSHLSLQNLLVLVALAGVSFALYGSFQGQQRMIERIAGIRSELAAVREENRRIRAEFGFLEVADLEKVHAVRVPLSGRAHTWTYRVFLPYGNEYYAACRINDLPLDGKLPRYGGTPPGPRTISGGGKNTTGIGLAGGEYLITLSVFIEEGLPKYTMQCQPSDVAERSGQGGGTGGAQIMDVKDKWPIRPRALFAVGGVTHEVTVSPREKPLILLDGRFFDESVKDSGESTEGIISWIEILPSTSSTN